MNRAGRNATESNSCEHNREHHSESSRRRCNIQPQKPEPNHFQREKNQTRTEADEKQTPGRPITRIEAERKFGVRGRVGTFETYDVSRRSKSRDRQGNHRSNTNRCRSCQTCAVKSKCADQISFAENSAKHRPERV